MSKPVINKISLTSLTDIQTVNQHTQIVNWLCQHFSHIPNPTIQQINELNNEYIMFEENLTRQQFENQYPNGLSKNKRNSLIKAVNTCFAYYKNIDFFNNKFIAKTKDPIEQINALTSVMSKESQKFNLSICDFLNSCGITDYIDNTKANKLTDAFTTMFNFMHNDFRNKSHIEKDDFYDMFSLYYAWSRFEKTPDSVKQKKFEKLYLEGKHLTNQEKNNILSSERSNWKAFRENFTLLGIYQTKEFEDANYYKIPKDSFIWIKTKNGALLAPNFDYSCYFYKQFINESNTSEKNNLFRNIFRHENILQNQNILISNFKNLSKEYESNSLTETQKNKYHFLYSLLHNKDGSFDPYSAKVRDYCICLQLKNKYPYLYYRTVGFKSTALLEGVFAMTSANALSISPEEFKNHFIDNKSTINDAIRKNQKKKYDFSAISDAWWKKSKHHFLSNTFYTLDGIPNNTSLGKMADMIHIVKINSTPKKYHLHVTEPANYQKAEEFISSELFSVLTHILLHLPKDVLIDDIENISIISGAMMPKPELEKLNKLGLQSIQAYMKKENPEYVSGRDLPFLFKAVNIWDFTESQYKKEMKSWLDSEIYQRSSQYDQNLMLKQIRGQKLSKAEQQRLKKLLKSNSSILK